MSTGTAPERSDRRPLEAHVGDRIHLLGPGSSRPVRDGVVLQVRHRDGSPPYRVRWSDSHYPSMIDPGLDAYIDHDECDPEST